MTNLDYTKVTPFYELYAQTAKSYSDVERQCTLTMQRNWNTTDDYWEIRKNTDEKFNDINFPTDDAIAWKEFGESGALDSKNITWKPSRTCPRTCAVSSKNL